MQSLSQIEQTLYQTFYKGPPFEFWRINGVKNVKGGPYKISNIYQVCSTWLKLCLVWQIKKISKQPKFEVFNSKNKKIVATRYQVSGRFRKKIPFNGFVKNTP